MLQNNKLIKTVRNICGRFILNNETTRVEECLSMHYCGPSPAASDIHYTSVGADGIKRFSRPLAFQNWSNSLLPEELKNENPSGIWEQLIINLQKHHYENICFFLPPFYNRQRGKCTAKDTSRN